VRDRRLTFVAVAIAAAEGAHPGRVIASCPCRSGADRFELRHRARVNRGRHDGSSAWTAHGGCGGCGRAGRFVAGRLV